MTTYRYGIQRPRPNPNDYSARYMMPTCNETAPTNITAKPLSRLEMLDELKKRIEKLYREEEERVQATVDLLALSDALAKLEGTGSSE